MYYIISLLLFSCSYTVNCSRSFRPWQLYRSISCGKQDFRWRESFVREARLPLAGSKTSAGGKQDFRWREASFVEYDKCAGDVSFPTMMTIAVSFPTMMTIAVSFPTMMTIAVSFPTMMTIAVSFPTMMTIAVSFPTMMTIAVSFPTMMTIAVSFPTMMTIAVSFLSIILQRRVSDAKRTVQESLYFSIKF